MKSRAAIANADEIGWLRRERTVAARRPIWKVGASLNLPVAPHADEPWDSAAAANAIAAHCGLTGPWGPDDAAMMRKGFCIYDSANVSLRSSYRLPIAAVIGGVLTVVPVGLAEARLALEACADFPIDVRMKALRVLDFYCEKAATIALADRG